MAFSGCRDLRTFQLNEGIQEVGWLCLQAAGVPELQLPPQAGKTREQLGLDQRDPKVLRLPDGLEIVGNQWFAGSDIERLVVSSGVRELGARAFAKCRRLREVVFESGSRLERIGDHCFHYSGLRSVAIPRSVRVIDRGAFSDCTELSSLSIDDESQLQRVGGGSFFRTQISLEAVKRLETLTGTSSEFWM